MPREKTLAEELAGIPPELRTDMKVAGMLGIWLWLRRPSNSGLRRILALIAFVAVMVLLFSVPLEWTWPATLTTGIAAFILVWASTRPKKGRSRK